MTHPYPESADYRRARDELLAAEIALREQTESVAALRRELPLGRQVPDYVFAGMDGAIPLSELFGHHDTLLLYSFMYGPEDDRPCPMCSAFVDSLNGHLQHIEQRLSVAVVARAPIERITQMSSQRGWSNVVMLSAGDNTYAEDFRSEIDGRQVPLCNVFVRRDAGLFHFWGSEMFFAPSPQHPRHVDMLWPLWHFFDLTPEGRGDFMPRLDYPAP